ncbi:MAG: hypothetical protein GY820_05965, partial [Gammaproteobacteria bacterium]|nr:hypothetical protein [Gammaproteobacteria bacterium]
MADYDSNWEDLLGSWLLAYNMSPHSSTNVSPYAAMFGREGRRPSASMLSKRPSPFMWSLEHWIDQLPHYLRKMWQVVKENAQRAQKAQAKQYDKNKKGHKLQVGERVLWFRPQDLSGDDRKFALPYIGPYIVTELKGLNNVFIRLENSTQEPFLVNVDQLSRCYAGLSMEGPLQFSHTTKPRRANRGRKARLKEEIEQTQPNHQMTLRHTPNLNFDDANSISRCAMMDSKCIEVACDRDRMARTSTCEDQSSKGSFVLFSCVCDDFGMADRQGSHDEQKRGEDERRRQEDQRRAKEDARRREEDERRRREDEAKRAVQFAQDFGQQMDHSGRGQSRRKEPRSRQSYSPPKPPRGSFPARAQSHQYGVSQGQQGGAPQQQSLPQQQSASSSQGNYDYKEWASLQEEAKLQKKMDELKASRLRRFEDQQKRIAQERQSRPEQKAAGSQYKSSSTRPSGAQSESNNKESQYARDRGPGPLGQQGADSSRPQSSDARLHREGSRERSGSVSQSQGGPIAQYHRRVEQEQKEMESMMGSMPPPASGWHSGQGTPSWRGWRGPGYGHGRKGGKGRGFSPRGGEFRGRGRPFGRSPSPRGRGRGRGWRGEGWLRLWGKEGTQSSAVSQETTYGEYGEYQRDEVSEGSITPTRT